MSTEDLGDALRTFAFLFARTLAPAQVEVFLDAPAGSGEPADALRADTDGRDPAEVAEALAEEYTRLFIGPLRHSPPQEGLARGDEELLGPCAREVVAAYEAAGFEADRETGLLPDHLSVELGFLATLLDRGETASAEHFLDRHILQWVPEWVDRFAPRARLRFYPAAARSLRACLKDVAAETATEIPQS